MAEIATHSRNYRKAQEMAGVKYYLAGPMTGLPLFNIPVFEAAALFLRTDLNLEIVSPVELDSPEIQAAARVSTDGALGVDGKIGGETWGDILARDVRLLADGGIGGIIFLPGWERSRGARLEAYVNILCSKPGSERSFWLFPSLERVSANYIHARL